MVIRKLLSRDIEPLKKSIPRPDFEPGPRQGGGDRQPRVVKMPNDSLVMPLTWQRPEPTTSADTGYDVNPENQTGQAPDGTLGPDPRLPSQGKIFGKPPVHMVPPRGGRLQLTPRKSIPETR